jgi:hypothetical protein
VNVRWLALAAYLMAQAAAAEPLQLEAGRPVLLACTTHAVVVAPEAASTNGTFRIKLEAKDQASSWSVADVSAAHTGSLAARYKDACPSGCPLLVTQGKPLELWAPLRVAPASMPAGQPLTLTTLKPETLKLSASTFIDNAIAALEQGECKVAQ